MMKMEAIILKNLLKKEPFLRKALPYLKSEYFQDKTDKVIFEEIQAYVGKYNNVPDISAIGIAISNRKDVFDTEFKDIETALETIKADETDTDQAWLAVESEKFCQEQAIHNALLESIEIHNGSNSKQTKDKGAIPKILSDALAVTFDPNVGHDYLDDSDARYAYYHRKAKKYPFDLDFMNRITGGGLEGKTLTCILAPPNTGKTLMMCHFAAAFLAQHYNVLYITLEMAQEKISARIDANLLDMQLNALMTCSKEQYDRKMNALKAKVRGKLIVKEYPTASAGTNHFRALLNELALKRQFHPDIIFVDYINLCASSRVKMGNNVNSYTLIKSIAEELRGLAMEFNLPVVTATQTTRNGATNTDPDMTDTSESFGLPATVDLMLALITSDELYKLNQIVIKQIKNRDNDVNENKRFVLGVDRPKMRLYDVSPEQQNIADANQSQATHADVETNYKGNSGGNYDKFKNLNRF
jgi:replicative DNA helicase